MGLYWINCKTCTKTFYWWSGCLDQRCSECRKQTAVLTNDERAALDRALQSSVEVVDEGTQAGEGESRG